TLMKNSFRLLRASFVIISASQCQIQVNLAQTNLAPPIGPRTILTNSAPTYFRDRSPQPISLTDTSLGPSPSAGTNFLAVIPTLSPGHDSVYPPDTFGALSATYAMTTLNTDVKIQTRVGVTVKTATLQEFWTSTNLSYTSIYDP